MAYGTFTIEDQGNKRKLNMVEVLVYLDTDSKKILDSPESEDPQEYIPGFLVEGNINEGKIFVYW